MSIKLEPLLGNYFAEKAFQNASGRTPDCLPFSALADAPAKGLRDLQPSQVEHARTCQACQLSLILSLRSQCPSEKQLHFYREGKSTIAEAITAHLKLQACAQCRKVTVPLAFAVTQAGPASRPLSPRPRRWLRSFSTWRFVLTAACLLVVVLIGLFSVTPIRQSIASLVRWRRPSLQLAHSGVGVPLIADPIVVARSSSPGQVEIESPSVPSNLEDLVRQMLEAKPVSQPAAIQAALDQTRFVLGEEERLRRAQSRGSGNTNPAASPVVSPAGELVATLHLSFHWNVVAHAQGFRITLVDTADRAHPVNFPRSEGSRYFPAADTTSFTLPGDTYLQPGHTYEWQLVAKTNGTPIYFPPAFFTVLDPQSLVTLQQFEIRFSASPLVRAALYQSYGCFDDAEAQIDKISSPDRKLTDAMRANLRAQRAATTGIQH